MSALPLDVEIGKVFTPATPVNLQSLFAGRIEQLRRVADAINQGGQHVVVFGERGVGKTSLANIVSVIFAPVDGGFLIPRVNCDSNDIFLDLWKKVFNTMLKTLTKRREFDEEYSQKVFRALESVEGYITPSAVCTLLEELAETHGIAIIFDECDRLQNAEARTGLADAIKTLSDHTIGVTIILVGVADSVDDLLSEHQSLERALVQVQMPRMSVSELQEIVDLGMTKLGMQIDDDAKELIAILSRGLPHYTHLLARQATRRAVERGSLNVKNSDVFLAIYGALEDVTQSIRSAYLEAVSSAHKGTLYQHVLAACAMAPANELGWFSIASVREPMQMITGRSYEIGGFARHVGAFCERDRGTVLQRTGQLRNFRYRFTNPLMQPYAILRAIADGIIEGKVESFL